MKPILFMIGPFHVFSFGLFLSLSFILTSFFVYRFGRENLMDEEDLMDTYVYTSLVALLFARIFYILFHFSEFTTHILKYFIVRESPGLSLMGALFGAAIYLFGFRKIKQNTVKVADIFSVSFCFGFILMSIGEFVGGASYGRLTTLPWGVRVAGLTGIRHPVELYASLFFLLLFLVLLILRGKISSYKVDGFITLLFLWGLGIGVFLLEFFKMGSVYLYSWISFNQATAVILILVLSFLLFRQGKIIYTISKSKKV